MMKLTQATDYAFRLVLYLAKNKEEVVEAKYISEAEKIPRRFLLKIARQLIQAGIIESYRGQNGGYKIARDPAEITLKDVVLAIEGSIIINKCQEDPEFCNRKAQDFCAIHCCLNSILAVLEKEFEKYTFATLLNYNRN